MTLREHMCAELQEGWAEAIPRPWRAIFEKVTPAFFAQSLAGILHDPDVPAYPRLQAAQNGGHIFRAFDNIEPRNVRVVVIGQDPYPNRESATGRAFEDGAWNGERPQELARSLKPLVLAA